MGPAPAPNVLPKYRLPEDRTEPRAAYALIPAADARLRLPRRHGFATSMMTFAITRSR